MQAAMVFGRIYTSKAVERLNVPSNGNCMFILNEQSVF